MKRKTLTIAAVPFIILTGCSSQPQNKNNLDPIGSSTQHASTISETSESGQWRSQTLVQPDPSTGSEQRESAVLSGTTSPETADSQAQAQDVEALPTLDELVVHSLPEDTIEPIEYHHAAARVSESENILSGEKTAGGQSVSSVDDAGSVATQPEALAFHFGFDTSTLTDDDITKLEAHALYLIENPDRIITVHGHADPQGDSNYNQYLSRQRAEHVAKILRDAGVPGAQIEIKAWGDQQLLSKASHNRDHRRVELEYRDSFVASNTE